MNRGDRVHVARLGEATFEAHATAHKEPVKGAYFIAGSWSRSLGKKPRGSKGCHWTDDAPRPWYPHGQVATVVEVRDSHVIVETDDGRRWPHEIGVWAVEVTR